MKLKLFGTQISASYTLLCLAAVCIILGIFDGFLWCFLSVLIHEAGHIVPMKIFGQMPQKIKISLFEITICDAHRICRTPRENIIIIFFGPLANFICFIIFYLLYLFSGKNNGSPFVALAVTNAFVGLFNMLPVLSLDGGQLMYIVLCRFFDNDVSRRAVNIATFLFIFPLSALGFLLLFHSKYNFSLLAVSMYLVMSLILRREPL